jgi:hypothetical protein
MSLREIDVVLTTNEAINFLKISKPMFLNISALEKLGPSKLVMVGGCSNQNYIDL